MMGVKVQRIWSLNCVKMANTVNQADYVEKVKNVFGFILEQIDVLKCLVKGRDVFIACKTGFGKSF